ncbi:S-adenosyl-L-methionine-dependent methyltransferase [Periconia macrospinosa]|uniref:S-adenosyl-L-methionine-dependent methyltransferase n=1 Tax=Periconia macrospinosa TaxID=97972 RepID=A0A2V1DS87_9PLEO|nr:S-adenosyl-L-methionine-dependent methyltransferase [Periconia macrospinosa]
MSELGEDIYYKGDENYWEAYKEGRPRVPDSFFERIVEYHARHGGQFDVWDEIGAGGAVHTKRLSNKFKKTIISDSGASNIEVAKNFLGESDSYQFRIARSEEASDLEPNSVDLVFGANMIHWTDIDKTLQAVLQQLKPGGTLALGGFAVPLLLDEELHKLWLQVLHRFYKLLVESDPSAIRFFTQAGSSHDCIPFDTQYFQPGTIRIKLNERDGWTFRRCIVPPAFEESTPHLKSFGKDDEFIYENDYGWDFDADVTIMRKILESYEPKDDPVMEELWKQFAAALGDRKVAATWPVALTLATKK